MGMSTTRPLLRLLAVSTVMAVLAAGCGDAGGIDPTDPTAPDRPQPVTGALVSSDLPRSSAAPPSTADPVIVAGNEFATDVYRQLAARDGNLVFSPVSIRLALAMAAAGAGGSTAEQMADGLGLGDDPAAAHAVLNALDQALESRNFATDDGGVELSIANALWGQEGFDFEEAFLDRLASDYGAGMQVVDFVDSAAREQARQAINDWVAAETNDRIQDIIPEGALNAMSRLVLANAVYLDATWARTFEPEATDTAPFFRLDGSSVDVEMMHQTGGFAYARGDGWQAVRLPYMRNETAMLVIVPDTGRFAEIEAGLDATWIAEAAAALAPVPVRLGLPRFEFESDFSLNEVLTAIGMVDAFDPGAADFSGMTTQEQLFIAEVLHKAFVAVDEEGTEAAAATAVIMEATAAPVDEPIELTIDRPFVFALEDLPTETLLFLGRVTDPAA